MSNQETKLSNLAAADQEDGQAASGGNETQTDDETAIEQTSEDEPSQVPKGVVFEVLKNERRRRTIRYLREAEDVVTLGEVSKHIAALENDKDVDRVSYGERKRVYVGLYQCHLPKMDDMGVVDFNQDRGRIELTEQTEQLYPYLDDKIVERPWHRYYVGLSAAGLAVLLLTAVSSLPAMASVVPVVLGFAVVSAVHAGTVDDLSVDL